MDSNYKKANELYKNQNYEEAISFYEKAIELNEADKGELYYNMGVCYSKNFVFTKQEKWLELSNEHYIKALKSNYNKLGNVYHNMSCNYINLDNMKLAYILCKRAVCNSPEDTQIVDLENKLKKIIIEYK